MFARLDSSLKADGGWTTPAARAAMVLRCDEPGEGATLRSQDGQVLRHWPDPLAALRWLDESRGGGARWVGFLAYELGALFEPRAIPSAGRKRPASPLFAWGLLPQRQESPLPPRAPDAAAEAAGITRVAEHISHAEADAADPHPRHFNDPHITSLAPASTLPRPDYLRAAGRCLHHIAAGDVFQINLSQRFTIDIAGDGLAARADTPRRLYDHLLARFPAAYGGLIDLGDFAVVSNSPELFLRVTPDRRVVTRPIKGTRPRGRGMRRELLASEKDAAELNMIVDLERNDLGRICEIGSVGVSQPRTVETHPTVHHGVATVEGKLRGDVGLVELLAATFPGGSVTGAPKIRAMQIIDDLEPPARGVYCGAVGYLDADGSMQLNVAIRTMTLAGGRLHVPVGGGIVADSDPQAEYEETLVKAEAMLAAAESVRSGRTPVAHAGEAAARPRPRARLVTGRRPLLC